jgi:hypothetical protein
VEVVGGLELVPSPDGVSVISHALS